MHCTRRVAYSTSTGPHKIYRIMCYERRRDNSESVFWNRESVKVEHARKDQNGSALPAIDSERTTGNQPYESINAT